jgi:sialate O-acetylesterase
MNAKSFQQIFSMFKLTIVALFFSIYNLTAQTSVFSDYFDRGIISPGGTPEMTWTSGTTATPFPGVSTISGNSLRLSVSTTSGSVSAGRTYVMGTLSKFASPFSTILSKNTEPIVWTFNTRAVKTSSALRGFDAGATGSAIILAMSGSDPTNPTSNGYAVTIKSRYPISGLHSFRLVKFKNGLIADTNVDSLIGVYELAANSDFASVKVVYTPSTNNWALFVRDDGATTFADPTAGVYTQVGTNVLDSTYTKTTLTNFGFLWNHATNSATSTYGIYDNFKVTLGNNEDIVSMPNIFGNNMVLQQNTKVPVWGWALTGTTIKITASWGQIVTATSGNDGKWKDSIQTPVAIAGQAPQYTLTVDGPKNKISFTNVLVGEVWLCSGQSNMVFPMNYTSSNGTLGVMDYANEIAAANYPNIHFFRVNKSYPTSPATNCIGSWSSCTPSTVSSFSAVAYYFGKEIYNNKAINVPVGLILDSHNGSSIQAWTKREVLEADLELKAKYIDPTFPQIYTQPSLLYNGMLAPIIPFAIKGALWYQGESNSYEGGSTAYNKANVAMLNDWRKDWGRNFSFYAVQIAPNVADSTTDLLYNKAMFREVQSNILSIQKTGIIATADLMQNKTELTNVHPRNKKSVGVRLANWALANDYGQNIQFLGLKYLSYSVEGNKIRIYYQPESLGQGLTTKDNSFITCFKIAGADKIFYPALATIDGSTVVVSSPKVSVPVAVRYAFSDGPMSNLMNIEGIAAYPFRTDSWTNVTYVDEAYPTFVNEINLQKTIISPNPCHNFIKIDGTIIGISKIEIFDMIGRKVKSQVGNRFSDNTIEVSDISNGAYMLKIYQNDFSPKTFKVLKN